MILNFVPSVTPVLFLHIYAYNETGGVTHDFKEGAKVYADCKSQAAVPWNKVNFTIFNGTQRMDCYMSGIMYTNSETILTVVIQEEMRQ